MIGFHNDTTVEEIYKRIKHIVDDVYRKKGMSSNDIRNYFQKKRNFNRLLKVMGDLRYIYDESKYPLKFENQVFDILFYRVLMDRIYYEKDNPEDKNDLEKYDDFVAKKNKKILSTDHGKSDDMNKLLKN
jgi:phosphoenolpyruvate synthase/pyruvate phosphate dikinase